MIQETLAIIVIPYLYKLLLLKFIITFYLIIISVQYRENMVLRRIFGPRKEKVTGEWRRSHSKELNDLYSSPNIVRLIKSSGAYG